MVLEETLLFDSSEGADAFIKYLRKKGCKAHKDTVASFDEKEELEGTIDNLIAFLNFLVERDNLDEDDDEEDDEGDEAWDIVEEDDEADEARSGAGGGDEEERGDGGEAGDEDEEERGDSGEAGDEDEEWEGDEEWELDRDEERDERDKKRDWDPKEAFARVNRANRREKLMKGRARVAEVLESHNEGDVVYTEDDLKKHREVYMEGMLYKVFPIMQKNLSEIGIDLPDQKEEPSVSAEQTAESGLFLFTSDILEENGLVQKDDGGNYRLARKVPAGSCRLKVKTAGLGDFEEDDLAAWEIESHVTISMEARYEVAMDGTIIVEFSEEDIEDGLRGLDVDAESLDEFYSQFELKRLSALAVIEVVSSAGRISFEHLRERLRDYEVQTEEVTGKVMVTLEPEYLSALVVEMRKLGYLTGSQENIRMARK